MKASVNIRDYIGNLGGNDFSGNHDINAQFRFVLTQTCNESCFFCHNEGLPVERKFMDFDFFSKIIDVLKEEKYPQKIRFTGGEPMLHKGVFDFIDYVKMQLPESNVGITTNGLLIKKNIGKILSSGLNSLTVSIHSMIAERYERITKVDGLAIVLDGLRLLRESEFQGKIKINSVVDEDNIDEMPFFLQYAHDNGFELKIMDILKYDYENPGNNADNHISIEEIRRRLGDALVSKVKNDRTQLKCQDCIHKAICGHEAAYLRITPGAVINPCLSMKEYDIPLLELGEGDVFKKGVSLGLRRVSRLDL